MPNHWSAAREALAKEIIVDLRARSHKAYLVGGCVRDRLLGTESKDFDVNTDARPEQIAGYFRGSQLVGAHFGVILVSRGESVQVEVATFRSEDAYSDGRRPDVVRFETDPALDARRRDFTINGLMEDPISGEILDYVGGRADLLARTVRAIGKPEERFREDHLRMLRAVRFAARLGFSLEESTLQAIRSEASCIRRISAERIRDELIRILTEGQARRGLELLDETGLLTHMLPQVKQFQGVEQPAEFHPEGDVWAHVLIMLAAMRRPTPALAFGVLLHDVGKPPTFRVADRIRFDGHAELGAKMTHELLSELRLPASDVEHVTALVANHMKFKDVQQMRLSTLKRFLCLPKFEEHLELHRLDTLASNGYREAYEFVRAKLREFSEQELRPARLISGRDLIDLGYKPGPDFGQALEAVQTAQLEGEIITREQALCLARSILDRFAA
jgi:tRNA nucleotidyltransferase/poly(A) polymerase